MGRRELGCWWLVVAEVYCCEEAVEGKGVRSYEAVGSEEVMRTHSLPGPKMSWPTRCCASYFVPQLVSMAPGQFGKPCPTALYNCPVLVSANVNNGACRPVAMVTGCPGCAARAPLLFRRGMLENSSISIRNYRTSHNLAWGRCFRWSLLPMPSINGVPQSASRHLQLDRRSTSSWHPTLMTSGLQSSVLFRLPAHEAPVSLYWIPPSRIASYMTSLV